MAEKKVTKTEMFNQLKVVAENADRADLVAFCDKQIADIAKKNSARKSAIESEEGQAIKASALAIINGAGQPISVKDMFESSPDFAKQAGYSQQKVTAILTKAVEAGEVAKTKAKGITIYTAVAE